MRRGGRTVLVTAVLSFTAGLGSSALAQPPAHHARSHAPTMSFTHWVVKAQNSGAVVRQHVPPGGTFRICSSSKLTELDAHYRATGANGLSVHTVWKVTGQPANSEPGKLFPKGYFYVQSSHGLPDGTWSLKVIRHGRTLGKSSVTIAKEHC